MGLFSTLGEALKHQGLTLTITLEHPEYHWGDDLRGAVVIRGGAVRQTISRLAVRVVEHVDGGKDFSSWNPQSSIQIRADIAVEVGADQSFAFALRLPETGTPTGEGSLVRFLWSVEAQAHIAHALGSRTALTDFVLRNAPVSDALRAVRDAVLAAAPLRLRAEVQHGTQAQFQFVPLPQAASALDAVILIAEEIDGDVVGTVRINPQEHSLTDYTRALARRDIREHAIRFPAAHFAGSVETPVEVISTLKKLLQPFLAADS